MAAQSPTLIQLEPAKLIMCMLPDDGTDLKIMEQLRVEKNIFRVDSNPCRGVNGLQHTKVGSRKLPEPTLYRLLSVVVNEDIVNEVFDFIYENAEIGRPGRGALIQTTLIGATQQELPDDVPAEKS